MKHKGWRIEYGSKYLDVKVRPDNVVIVSIRTDESKQRMPSETTKLYEQVSVQLQELANQRNQTIEQWFSTRNESMKGWMLNKGVNMGFQIISEDGRILRAKKIYSPRT